MQGTAAANAATAAVARDFATSELFDRTFRDGMELVEETAAYLDGDGRRDSKLLSRACALVYAAESMRLTTRLMQVASWLLVQRAVREGEMNPADACDARYRLGAHEVCKAVNLEHVDDLPEGLLILLERSEKLYERVMWLDRRVYVEGPAPAEAHPVRAQHERLLAAFGNA